MLYMDRPASQSIRIGNDVTVRVVRIKGGRVRLAIDAPKALAVRDADDSLAPHTPHRHADHFTVLLVEDDDDHADIISQALADAGVDRVVRCPDAEDARAYLDEADRHPHDRPDLILLDLFLAAGTALPLITYLREHPRTACSPIVVLSNAASPPTVRAAREHGADAYLAKDPDYDRFRETIYTTVRFWTTTASPGAA